MSVALLKATTAPRARGHGGACFARLGVWTLIVVGLLLVFVPLLLTLYLSVFNEKLILFPPHGYTLAWYPAIIPNFGSAIVVSFELAIAAVIGSLLLGVPAGIALSRYHFRGRGVISTLLLAPLTMPGIALGLAIYLFLVLVEIETTWRLTGSLLGLVLAHLLITTPWVVRLVMASLANHDRSAEDAALSLGARPRTVIWRVTLPAMRQGIIAAGLFAFILSFGDLELALFLVAPGVTTLPVAVLEYLEYHIDPLIAAVAVAQMLLVGILMLVLDRFIRLGQIIR